MNEGARDAGHGRFSLIAAAHLLLMEDGKILLLLRQNTGYEDGRWGVVAGHLDGGETARQAMAREAYEEAGLLLAPEELRLAHVMHRGVAPERVDFFFAAERWAGTPQNREPQRCAALAWCPLDALPTEMVPYIAAAIAHVRAGRVYSEHNWPDPAGPALRRVADG